MTKSIICAAVFSFVMSLSPDTLGADNPSLESALDLLRDALATNRAAARLDSQPAAPATNKPDSASSQPSQADIISMLKASREALRKAPPVYKGRRERAIEYVDAAIKELNAGDPKKKSASYIRKAITEIRQAIMDVKPKP